MHVHALQHVPFEGLGSIADWLIQRRAIVSYTKFYESMSLPAVSDVDLLIILGGPMGVQDEEKFPWLAEEKRFVRRCIDTGVKVLGICLGAQIIAAELGSQVYANAHKEIGWFPVEKLPAAAADPIFTNFPDCLEVFHWHGDTFDLPNGAKHVARSAGCEHQAFVYDERIIGLQFHLETTLPNVQQLIAHCADEILSGPYIQKPEIMTSNRQRFDAINSVMHELLNQMM